MKILIDGQTLQSPERYRGIGRYLINILKYLNLIFSDNTYYISITNDIDLWDLPKIIIENAQFIRIDIDSENDDSNLRSTQYRNALEEWVRKKNIDIYWNPNPLMTNVLFAGKINGCKSLVTVHDVIPLIFPKAYLHDLPKGVFEDYMSRLTMLASFDCVLTDSKSTKEDLRRFADIPEEKLIVLYYGIDKENFEICTQDDIDELKLRYGLPKEYIFTVGGPDFRKNADNLIKAFSLLVNQYEEQIHLVLGSYYDHSTKSHIKDLAKKIGIENRIMFTGKIAEGDLNGLYTGSKIFVFPSFYEGFGIPVLEAMISGCTVAASNTSSIPEVLGNTGLYFDPNDVQDIAKKMKRLITDTDLRKILSKKSKKRSCQFSVDKIVKQMLQIFKTLLIRKPPNKYTRSNLFQRKIRLAFFSPLNPQESGISDYSEDLLEHLKEHAEIDLFVNGIIPSNRNILNSFNYYSYDKFEDIFKRKPYDNIIYHMGNNLMHEYIYSTLTRYPGITVLHDYNIHPFVSRMTIERGNRQAYCSELKKCYKNLGDLLSDRVEKEDKFLDTLKFTLNERIFETSKMVIVHSNWAKKQVTRENIVVVPQGVNIDSEVTQEEIDKLRCEKSLSQDQFIVSCFGDIVGTKRIDVVIKAFSILKLFVQRSKLVLVGKCYKEMGNIINTLIERYGLGESVLLTGRVPLKEYKNYMKLTDIIINLRYPTLGETSASLLKSMSYGKPIILSKVNQFNEIPDGCCSKIDVGMKEQSQLLDVLLKLEKNPSLRYKLGQKAREYVVDHCSWDQVVKKYLDILYSYSTHSSNTIGTTLLVPSR